MLIITLGPSIEKEVTSWPDYDLRYVKELIKQRPHLKNLSIDPGGFFILRSPQFPTNFPTEKIKKIIFVNKRWKTAVQICTDVDKQSAGRLKHTTVAGFDITQKSFAPIV